MRIIELEEGDLGDVRALQPQDWSDIVPFFRRYLALDCCRPVKAVADGRIAGVGCSISFGRTGWIAHIIVAADLRNKGIGSAIVDEVCGRLHRTGCRSISLIATELGEPVYRKFGFVDRTDYLFFESGESPDGGSGTSSNGGIGETAGAVPETAASDAETAASGSETAPSGVQIDPRIEPLTERDRNAVLELDRDVSGEDRSGFILDRLDGGFVIRSDERVTGCYLPEAGEGLVDALDPEAGTAMLALRRSRSGRRGVFPAENAAAAEFYRAAGYRQTFRAKRMYAGPAVGFRPEAMFGRIGGNVG